MKLSARLKVVFEHLLPQKDVWDICCDHGYLGMTAYQQQNFPNVYFVDQVSTIIEHLRVQFSKHTYRTPSNTAAHFICESAENISTVVNGTVCIAGVGGLVIFKILQGLSRRGFMNADRLILGPHRDEEKLMELIKSSAMLSRYHLINRVEVIENNRARSIFIFDKLTSNSNS